MKSKVSSRADVYDFKFRYPNWDLLFTFSLLLHVLRVVIASFKGVRAMDKEAFEDLLSEHPLQQDLDSAEMVSQHINFNNQLSLLSSQKTGSGDSVLRGVKRKANLKPATELDKEKKREHKKIAINGFRVDEECEMEAVEMSIRDRLLDELHAGGNDSSLKKQAQAGSDPKDIEMQQIIQKEKKVIKMKRRLPNLALPEGWLALNHRSGGILYLHRSSRVVTWSRPYHIGGGSVRKHDVPVAAIPCLHQLKALVQDLETCHDSNKKKLEQASITVDVEESNVNQNPPIKKGVSILNMLNTVGSAEDDEGLGTTEETLPACSGESDAYHRTESSAMETTTDYKDVLSSGLDVEGSASADDDISDIADTSGFDNTHKCRVTAKKNLRVNGGHDTDYSSDSGSGSSEPVNMCDREKDQPLTMSGSRKSSLNLRHSTALRPVMTQNSSQALELIDYDELESYLSRLWEFEQLTEQQEQNILVVQPAVPEEEELELPPILESLPYSIKGVSLSKQQNKEWSLNPGGKTPVAILHEYSQRVLKIKPEYSCYEGENASTPFVAEVVIDGITYGREEAASKKQAKQMAAEATLEIFIPGLLNKIRDYQISKEELQFFDKIKIEDPKVNEMCLKTGLPSPSQILDECLKRNQGVCPTTINFKIIPGNNQNHSFKITCGKHTATGFCRNKKTGKQLASQKILQKLHPRLETWGSLLRIYCDRPTVIVKNYKKEKEDAGLCVERPSPGAKPDLLLRLKHEMKKISVTNKQAKQENQQEKKAHSTSYNSVITVDI